MPDQDHMAQSPEEMTATLRATLDRIASLCEETHTGQERAYTALSLIHQTARKAMAIPALSARPSPPCEHPWCGKQTACCRPECPITMVQGNGRWQWTLPDRPSEIPWHDGILTHSDA